jgi:hypothetical protein
MRVCIRLTPQTKYCFCFETGVLVSFNFFASKSSSFTVFLVPANGVLGDARLAVVERDFVVAVLQADPIVFSDFLNGRFAGGMGGMGARPNLNISLPIKQLTAIRNRSGDR